MKRSNVLVTIGDGIDPRPEELRAQSKAIAEAGRAANAEEVGITDGASALYTSKPSGKSTAVVRFWRTDQQDREGKPKMLQQIPIFAKKYPEEAVTAFAVHDDLSQFAVGLKNGAVILFRS
ncbi:hypothetical protein BBJ28_00024299, partial [Nothophytophthora sp. Chile5]